MSNSDKLGRWKVLHEVRKCQEGWWRLGVCVLLKTNATCQNQTKHHWHLTSENVTKTFRHQLQQLGEVWDSDAQRGPCMSGYDQQAVCDELGLEYFVNAVEYINKILQKWYHRNIYKRQIGLKLFLNALLTGLKVVDKWVCVCVCTINNGSVMEEESELAYHIPTLSTNQFYG